MTVSERNVVYRGKVDVGTTLAKVISCLKDYNISTDQLKIVGSMEKGPRGSRFTDLDVCMPAPDGMSRELLEEIETQVQNTSSADFYFDTNIE